jgi:hypothetical protein
MKAIVLIRDIRVLTLIGWLVVGLAAVPAQVQAQEAVAVAGRVLDAGTGQPVPGALVVLEPLPGGLVVDPRSGAVIAPARTMVTGAGGEYRFGELPPGRYRLHVQRIGYRAATLEAEVHRPVDARLSIALELEPIALRPVLVEDRAASPFQRAANAPFELDAARVGSERQRQTTFLTPDARVLTYADVMDGVTLGEADVLRALQRFAGVATRDDYTAELWTRGASWSQTRVTFDGMPLFNPVHAVGLLSAITPEVLGVVFFHPGVRPVSAAEGAAAVVDLRSRRASGHGEVKGVADVSMASAKLALEQQVGDGRAAWIIAGRRSYFDLFRRGLDWLSLSDVDLPYAFHDLTGRLDVSLGKGAALEASALWEEDRLFGDVVGVLERTRAHWGNAAGRVTLHAPIAGLRSSHTAALSRYAARVQEYDAVERGGPPPWMEPRSENDLLYFRLTGEIAPIAAGTSISAASEASNGPARWSAGYEFTWRVARYDGPLPRYHPVKPDTIVRIRRQGELGTAALWTEARIGSARLMVNPGLRVEVGDEVSNAPAFRLAPGVSMRWAMSPEQSFSIAVGRSWQYVQAIALAGPSPHPAFHASQFWLWAGEDEPALRADVATIGTERWLGDGWLASITAFARETEGVGLPHPAPGALNRRPLFVVGQNRARGLDASIRRVGARWSTAVAYSYGTSNMTAEDLTFPAAADRRHALDVMAGVRIAPSVRIGAAYTAMSGAPYTRAMFLGTPEECTLFGYGCHGPTAAVQRPNAERTPSYRSLDASIHWNRALGSVEVSAYAQVRNLFDRDNATTYSGTSVVARTTDRPQGLVRVLEDRFERGLPRLPMLGARLTF